jgi:acetoin utilization deacetylase AcuC-like enzyme
MASGFLYDPVYLDHDAGVGHPERPDRLIAVMEFLKRQTWFSAFERFTPRPAAQDWIETIHAHRYVERVEQACRRGLPYLDVFDVGISAESYQVAKMAVGGVLTLADNVVNRTVDNGFALVRPPGHHAEHDLALGFCLFNNIAIVARYLQRQHGLEKIAILDWDVHHGNGTQHSFEEDPSVLYVSLHQYPFYPGTGSSSETGKGKGQGATLNCPMPAGVGDEEYREAFTTRVLPKLHAFQPQAVLISAGFDAHAADPLAQINLSTAFYGWMTARVMEIADQYAEGRLISMLEGGYSLDALPRCVAAHLAELAGVASSSPAASDRI